MDTEMSIREAAGAFLANHRVAVTGVSRHPRGHGGNIVLQRLRERDYEAFAVNPNAVEIDGRPCYPSLAAIPGGVDAVVIATRPDHALQTVRECAELGIRYAWMHRSFGPGSVSHEAAKYGEHHGVTVIEGGCPLMFAPTADGAHAVMRLVCSLAGTVPRRVAPAEPASTPEPAGGVVVAGRRP